MSSMTTLPLKTPAAARALGVTYWRLVSAIRCGRLAPPAKDSSGDFVWTEEDLERARAALAVRKGKGVQP